MSPFTAYPLAKAAAAKAIALDPTLAEAQTSLAFATFIFDRDYPKAEAAYQRALQANPGYATAHQWYGEYLSAMGRLDEAFAEFERARTLDPLSVAIRDSVGSTLVLARRYDEAIAELRASLQTGSGQSSTYYYLIYAYAMKGMFGDAAAVIADGTAKMGSSPTMTAVSGLVSAMAGDRSAAHRTLLELGAPATGPHAAFIDLAYIHASLGESDRAFELLGNAEEAREPAMLWVKLDPFLDPLRSDARFATLLGKLRLVP
jgi:tetratricopeptide (TPR) repeat protein